MAGKSNKNLIFNIGVTAFAASLVLQGVFRFLDAQESEEGLSEFAKFLISCLFVCAGYLVHHDYEAGPTISVLTLVAQYLTQLVEDDFSINTNLLLRLLPMLAFCTLIAREGVSNVANNSGSPQKKRGVSRSSSPNKQK